MFGFRARTPKIAATPSPTLRITLPDGVEVDVRRVPHRAARGLKLTVTERGARLTTPTRCSDARAQAFLREHAAWLAEQLAHAVDVAEPLRIGQTTALPLRGESVPLRWREGRFVNVTLDDDGIAVALPQQAREAAVRRALSDFYTAQARADVARWMPRYLDGLPQPPLRLRFKTMSSLWGSMTVQGALSLDLALVLARPAAFEYVLVHELCHLLHADHSRAFWHAVEHRFPAWREERAYLRADGRRLKSMLLAMCGASA